MNSLELCSQLVHYAVAVAFASDGDGGGSSPAMPNPQTPPRPRFTPGDAVFLYDTRHKKSREILPPQNFPDRGS